MTAKNKTEITKEELAMVKRLVAEGKIMIFCPRVPSFDRATSAAINGGAIQITVDDDEE